MARTYHVLQQDHQYQDVFHQAASLEASSPAQAIRLVAIEKGTGRYVAVPESNWTEIGVRVEIPAPRVIFDTDEPTAAVEPQSLNADLDALDDHAIAEQVAERDAADTGERLTVEELAESVGEDLSDPEFQARKEELSAHRKA